MSKRVIIIHGWGGNPEEGWFPWAKKELEQRGFSVVIPAMPNTEEPTIAEWVAHLGKIVGEPNVDTHLVGHSIGCQAILRYLESLAPGQSAGKVVFVAGWFDLDNMETDEERLIAKPWIATPIDFEKVREHVKDITAILSDNDPYGFFEANRSIFEEQLGARVIVESGKGHLDGGDGIIQLPSVLSALIA